jgi:hypothetical protein
MNETEHKLGAAVFPFDYPRLTGTVGEFPGHAGNLLGHCEL